MFAVSKTLCPPDCAEAVRWIDEPGTVSTQPRLGDDAGLLESVEFERAEHIEAELSQDALQAALRFRFDYPAKPGGLRGIGQQPLRKTRLPEGRRPVHRNDSSDTSRMPG